jgi:hypothetical protein
VRDWATGAAPNYGLQLSAAAANPTTTLSLDSKENTTTSHPAFLDVFITSVGPSGPQGIQGNIGPAGASSRSDWPQRTRWARAR